MSSKILTEFEWNIARAYGRGIMDADTYEEYVMAFPNLDWRGVRDVAMEQR